MSYKTLEKLESTIQKRKKASAANSYVAKLMNKGQKKMAQKVAEEAAEVAIAAVSETEEELIEESADLLFHLLVLLGHNNIALSEVVEVLAEREGVSGLLEKSKRGD